MTVVSSNYRFDHFLPAPQCMRLENAARSVMTQHRVVVDVQASTDEVKGTHNVRLSPLEGCLAPRTSARLLVNNPLGLF